MIHRLALIAFLICPIITSLSQSDANTPVKPRKGRPNIPGTIMVDFGLNFPFNTPPDFTTGVWGSRTVNLYYFVDKRIGNSKFSVHPGAGFGLERYKFTNNYTLAFGTVPETQDRVFMVPTTLDVSKSMLISNYFDALMDFRFTVNPSDPNRSFKVSLGIKGGYLFDSGTKLRYREDGETKRLKDKQNWNLSPFRYAATFRIGIGNFSLFATYNINPVFEKGLGPGQADFNNFTTGISLAAF
ncbi:MAG: PorT family protein [Cyclobacteriaceae bacterium]|jgi:hypothetical protein|nr:PorT family protein [Cyclobacteriaceae bacterium]